MDPAARLYSCDDQLDLPAVPPGLWQSRLPRAQAERGPSRATASRSGYGQPVSRNSCRFWLGLIRESYEDSLTDWYKILGLVTF
jgi:hypothetical protein